MKFQGKKTTIFGNIKGMGSVHLFPHHTQVAYLRGRRCKSDATDKLQVADVVVVLYVLVEICGFLAGECGISRSEVI